MKRIVLTITIITFAVIPIWANWPNSPLPDGSFSNRLVITKSSRTLELYKDHTFMRSYHVSLGRNPVGPKRKEGDGRTPEGIYTIDYHKQASSFYKALHISYPSNSETSLALAKGDKPGGLIMIHGMRNGFGFVGRLHTFFNWTDGCIAVTNQEIDEIWRAVPDGTPVEIMPGYGDK
ncbi:MAG: L,D-transpeptidase family protein [Nitrospirae bacterium]|nr:L,D-transpeptidase family protein [Nitrospirota bacterium]MBI3593750.1 L,D-transpeptidase family protein [Nitrospirota bacterium]